MPTYHVHDTTVKLYVWDPLQPVQATNKQEIQYPSNPACRHDVEPLKEEYFDGQAGVDFLGSSMPFFLINAGRDLFFKTRQKSDGIRAATPPEHQGQNDHLPVEDGLTVSDLPSLIHPKANKPPTNLIDDFDDDSGLPSIPPSMFARSSPLGNEDSAGLSRSSGTMAKSKPCAWRKLPPSNPEDVVFKPITSAKPIKIQIDLSRKSFIKSLYTNDALDICVNIFFNGEFVCSKVLRSRSATSYTAEEKIKHFCGRRVDITLEVPWAILPVTRDDGSILDKTRECSGFEDRWNKVNQLLLTEADEWGRAGKYGIFRAPVGEYLEELSKKPIPESMKGQGAMGDKAGIIDVVISVGGSTTINYWGNLSKPRRKLPKDICGKDEQMYIVPEELNPHRKAQIVADFEREEIARAANLPVSNRKPSIEDDGYFTTTATTKKVLLNDSNSESVLTVARSSMGQHPNAAEEDSLAKLRNLSHDTFLDNVAIQEEPSSSQPLALIMRPSRSLRGGSLPAIPSLPAIAEPQLRTRTKSTAMPTAPQRDRPRHPNRPEVTPQKSYKGPTPPAKRQRPDNPWEFIPFDADKLVSHSTRSKRSTAQPVFTPENLRGQELVDSYLTIRNKELEALPSTLEQSPYSKLRNDSVTSSPGDSSNIDSSPCKPLTRSNRDRESNPRTHEDGDASMDGGLRLDGAGDARKRRSDTGVTSGNTPTRSSKRKRLSRSPNMTLTDRDGSPIELPKSTKRTRVVSKDNKDADNTIPKVGQESKATRTRGVSEVLTEESIESEQKSAPGYFEEWQTSKQQRRPSRAMSARELSGLLTPHKPTREVNTSFGASFAEASSTRTTIYLPTKQKEGATETKGRLAQVTATYERRILVIKGLRGMTQNDLTHNPAKKAIDVAATNSILASAQLENETNTAQQPEAFMQTAQLDPAVQTVRQETPNKPKAKAATRQTAKSIGTSKFVEGSGTTSSIKPSSTGSSKETIFKDSDENFAKATKTEHAMAEDFKQSKIGNSKEVLPKTMKFEPAQSRNIKQLTAKTSTHGPAGTSMSASARNNKKVMTQKSPEIVETSQSESSLQTTAHARETVVQPAQGSYVTSRPAPMASPPAKTSEESKQPAATQQASKPNSEFQSSLGQNLAKASLILPLNVSGRLVPLPTPVKMAKETAKFPGEKATTKPDTKVLLAPQQRKESVKNTTGKSSTTTKPNPVIDPRMPNARGSRSYSTTSQGMKTPTPRSGTFATPKHTETPTTLGRTRSATSTMKDTPGTGGTNRMGGVPTPAVLVSQKVTKPHKPAGMPPPPPQAPLNLASTTSSAFTPSTAKLTPSGRMNAKIKEPPPPTPSPYADLTWKPNSLCTDSVLSYATAQMAMDWPEREYISGSGFAYRSTRPEREAVFRASGILMGVRFVLGVGRDEDEDSVEIK